MSYVFMRNGTYPLLFLTISRKSWFAIKTKKPKQNIDLQPWFYYQYFIAFVFILIALFIVEYIINHLFAQLWNIDYIFLIIEIDAQILGLIIVCMFDNSHVCIQLYGLNKRFVIKLNKQL